MKTLKTTKSASTLFTILMLIFTSCSFAGWKIPGTGGICIGFGCEGAPIVGSEWVKNRWEDLGQTPDSVAKICQHGGASCLDSNFIYIYQLLRAGQYGRVYQNVNDCAATGFTVSEGGHQAAQYVALAEGVPLPQEFMSFSQAMIDKHIVGACEVLFGQQFNQNSISYVDKGVYTTKGNENSIRNAIRQRSGQQRPPSQGGRQNGYPSGYRMRACGCWGTNPRPATEPRCASGQVRVNVCRGNFCAPGHPPYSFVCN